MIVHKIIRAIDDAYYGVKYGVPNLIAWFKIAWKDRDWDYAPVLIMLRFKLQKMARHSDRTDIYIGQKREAKRMWTCVYLIDRILADEYFENKRYLDLIHVNRDKANEFLGNLVRQDIDMLFNIMSKHIKKWWD